jgi:hypothetical protein
MDKPKNFKELKKRLQPFVNMDNHHVKMLEGNPGNRFYMPYYDRLIVLLTLLEAGWE